MDTKVSSLKQIKIFFWGVFDIWGTDTSEKKFKNVEFSKNVKTLHLLCSVQCHSHEMKVPSLFHSQSPKINTFWVISNLVKIFLILPFSMTQKWAITFYILFQSLNASRNFHSYGDFRAACNLKPNSNGSILKSLFQDSLFSTRCFALFERPAGPNPPAVIFVGELPPPT